MIDIIIGQSHDLRSSAMSAVETTDRGSSGPRSRAPGPPMAIRPVRSETQTVGHVAALISTSPKPNLALSTGM